MLLAKIKDNAIESETLCDQLTLGAYVDEQLYEGTIYAVEDPENIYKMVFYNIEELTHFKDSVEALYKSFLELETNKPEQE